MNLKRDNWTNDEVIAILRDCLYPLDPMFKEHNEGVYDCVRKFLCMKSDPKIDFGAFTLDTYSGRIVCIGPKLPQ